MANDTIPANVSVQYTQPQYYTDAATAAAGGVQDMFGTNGYLNNVQNNWYSNPLSTGVTPNYQSAINQYMTPNNQWANNVQNNQSAATQQAQSYNDQAGYALRPAMDAIRTGQQTASDAFGNVQGSLYDVNNTQVGANNYTNAMSQGLNGINAGQQTVAGATPYLQQGANYINGSSNYDANALQQYLNPYTNQAANAVVDNANRNLTENVLPGVNSTFTGAGQFGSSRNADFSNRAVRDNQEAVAKALAQANYGAYDTANKTYSDWANKNLAAGQALGQLGTQQAGIGATQGQLGAQQSNVLSQQAQNTLNSAGIDQNQAQLLANFMPTLSATQSNAANQYGNLSKAYSDIANNNVNQAGALSQMSNIGGNLSQQNIANMMTGAQAEQQVQQSALDKAYQNWLTKANFPASSMNAVGGVLGQLKPNQVAGYTSTGPAPTNIDKLASVLGILNTGANDGTINSLLNWIGTNDLKLGA